MQFILEKLFCEFFLQESEKPYHVLSDSDCPVLNGLLLLEDMLLQKTPSK